MSERTQERWERPHASIYQETSGPATWSASTYGGRFKSGIHPSPGEAKKEAQLLATESALNVTRAQRDKFAHLLDTAVEGLRAFIARIENAEATEFGDDYEREVAVALAEARSTLTKLERGTGE